MKYGGRYTDKSIALPTQRRILMTVNFHLILFLSTGKPMPRLRWWRDDKVVAQLSPVEDDSRISVLELRIPRLTRQYLEAVYTCTADNTLLVPPLRVNVQIQLYREYNIWFFNCIRLI